MPSKENSVKGRILFYAMGSGLGHLTRTHSIIRKLRALFNGELAVLTNSTYAPLFDFSPYTLHCIDTAKAGAPSVKETVEDYVKSFKPDILVVDTFPRGLAGELAHFLPDLAAKKVLIQRFLKEDYLRRFSVPDFIDNNFDMVISVEPVTQHNTDRVPTVLACPVLQRDCSELLPRETAREHLNVTGQNRIILCVIERIQRKDASLYTLLCKIFSFIKPRGFELRFASINKAEEEEEEEREKNPLFTYHFPLIEVLPAVDILIGPSGYNLYHESKALSITSLYLPQKMMYDDQSRRAGNEGISGPDALLERLSSLIDKVRTSKKKSQIEYTNEASRAASLIIDLLHAGS